MKNPRTWNRRDFSVTPNGYFNILKPDGWFSAVPLPGGFRYLSGQPKGPASEQQAPAPAGSQQSTIRLQTIESSMPLGLLRPALIVLAATALTWILLWCTSHP